jgi:hypothetical protein
MNECPPCITKKIEEMLESIESCNCEINTTDVFSLFEPVTKNECQKIDEIKLEENKSCECPKEKEIVRICKNTSIDFNTTTYDLYIYKMNNEKVCGGYHKIKHTTNIINTTNKEKEKESFCFCEE